MGSPRTFWKGTRISREGPINSQKHPKTFQESHWTSRKGIRTFLICTRRFQKFSGNSQSFQGKSAWASRVGFGASWKDTSTSRNILELPGHASELPRIQIFPETYLDLLGRYKNVQKVGRAFWKGPWIFWKGHRVFLRRFQIFSKLSRSALGLPGKVSDRRDCLVRWRALATNKQVYYL